MKRNNKIYHIIILMFNVLGIILGIWVVSTILAIPMAVGYRVEVGTSRVQSRGRYRIGVGTG